MTVEQAFVDGRDQFPVGMRVLAVDDDPTCLLLLDTLLRRCQYHVTTTSQAIIALEMLRENKDKFDLVISDVHMPDMDGFKLLELVGLEMDLPVIMLSANGDTKLVMKGIAHGACDYLLKPIRIEELKNIWQHVIRKKKVHPKKSNDIDNQDKPHQESNETTGLGNNEQRQNKRRKDQDEDDEEDSDDDDQDDGDLSSQKKPRVVWSVDLHRKFVAAVNQLGIDKAVPKKILELMNVDNLTRENVASHLQKYRLYLKRISQVTNSQANLVAMGSDNGYGFHAMSNPVRFHNPVLKSVQSVGMFGRLNPCAGVRGLNYNGMNQLSHAANSVNLSNDVGQFHNGSILHGMPMSLELDQLQREIPNQKSTFPLSSSYHHHHHLLSAATNKPLMLERIPQESQRFGNSSAVSISSFNPGLSAHSMDSEDQLSGMQSNPFHLSDRTRQVAMPFQIGTHQLDVSSIASSCNRSLGGKADLSSSRLDSSNASDSPISGNLSQGWDDHRHESYLSSGVNSGVPFHVLTHPLGQNSEPNNLIYQRGVNLCSARQTNFVDPMKHNNNNNNQLLSRREDYIMDQQKMQGCSPTSHLGSLEDLASAMMKKQGQDKTNPVQGDFEVDAFSFRTCI